MHDGSGTTGPQSVATFFLALDFPTSFFFFKIFPKQVYHALDDRLMEVAKTGELILLKGLTMRKPRPTDSSGCLK